MALTSAFGLKAGARPCSCHSSSTSGCPEAHLSLMCGLSQLFSQHELGTRSPSLVVARVALAFSVD